MTDRPDLDATCITCHQPVGDHTLRGYADCNQHLNYTLPYEQIPGGPLVMDGIDGHLAGEITVGGGFVEGSIGRFPAVTFRFTSPGAQPGTTVPLPQITLVGTSTMMRTVRQLVSKAVDDAVLAGRRGRRSNGS